MKIHLQKDLPFLMLVLAAVIVFCSLTSVAEAMELEPAGCSIFEYMLNADPGEDPHLKIKPDINVFYVPGYQGQSGLLVSSGNHQSVLTGQGRERDRTVLWQSRVKYKFRMIFHEFTLIKSR